MRTALAAASVMLASAAAAQTPQQRAIIEHVGVLYTAQKWCSAYVVATDSVALIATELGVDGQAEPYRSLIRDEMSANERGFAKVGAAAGCAQAYQMYGPEGRVWRNLIVRK